MRSRKWSRPGNHPAPETLLLFLEGELPARDGAAVAEHQKKCWSCRTHAERLGRGIRRFMEYRQDLKSHAAAPNPQGFSLRLNSVSMEARLPAFFRMIPRPVYVSCGLVLAVMTVVVAESIIARAPKKAILQPATESPRPAPHPVEISKSVAVLHYRNLTKPIEIEAPVPPSAQEMAEAEWQVRFAIHRIGADVGEDVHVESDAWSVTVRGVLESDDRKRQLEDQLHSISHAVSRLLTVKEAVAKMNPTAAPNQLTVSTPTPAFEKELESRFPASGERATFVNHALRLSGRASSSAFALHALLDRYDDRSVALLSDESRKQLEQVIREHLALMNGASSEFAAAIRPLMEPGALFAKPSQDNWRSNLSEAASLAIEIHERTLEALSGSTAGRSAETVRDVLASRIYELEPRLRRALQDLRQPFLIQN